MKVSAVVDEREVFSGTFVTHVLDRHDGSLRCRTEYGSRFAVWGPTTRPRWLSLRSGRVGVRAGMADLRRAAR